MDKPDGFYEEVCRALSDPSTYPHAVERLRRIDTHISTVFLTGRWVYKVKKAVDFGFLDFSTLEARRHFCEQEIRLNSRLSSGIYDSVVSLRLSPSGRVTLEGPGEPVEYAVRMVELPEGESLKALLGEHRIGREEMLGLGRHLADFYRRSARSPEIERYGRSEVIAFNMEENFRQVEPYVGDLVEREHWEFMREVSRAFFSYRQNLFERRVAEGRICDGHGDLRSDHIYFHSGIQIIDCIEFNDRFRYGDAVNDLAFLHMDMEHQGHRDLSLALLEAYVVSADDPGLYALIDFYATYRAVVKLKVLCLQQAGSDHRLEAKRREEIGRYLDQAYLYSLQFSRPTLWVVCGLPATGKSTLAQRLAQGLDLVHFQSDIIRKEMVGIPHLQAQVLPYDQGIYRTEMKNRVYARMLTTAQEVLKSGRSVILDATFSQAKWRQEARRLAADLDTGILFVECTCSEASVRRRLEQRERGEGVSDARLEHLPELLKGFEPTEELEPLTHLRVETDKESEGLLARILSSAYALKGRQVESIA